MLYIDKAGVVVTRNTMRGRHVMMSSFMASAFSERCLQINFSSHI